MRNEDLNEKQAIGNRISTFESNMDEKLEAIQDWQDKVAELDRS